MGRWLITNAPGIDLLPRPIIVEADREALPQVLRSRGIIYFRGAYVFLDLNTVEVVNWTVSVKGSVSSEKS